jgi:hypothetical protein
MFKAHQYTINVENVKCFQNMPAIMYDPVLARPRQSLDLIHEQCCACMIIPRTLEVAGG